MVPPHSPFPAPTAVASWRLCGSSWPPRRQQLQGCGRSSKRPCWRCQSHLRSCWVHTGTEQRQRHTTTASTTASRYQVSISPCRADLVAALVGCGAAPCVMQQRGVCHMRWVELVYACATAAMPVKHSISRCWCLFSQACMPGACLPPSPPNSCNPLQHVHGPSPVHHTPRATPCCATGGGVERQKAAHQRGAAVDPWSVPQAGVGGRPLPTVHTPLGGE